MISEEILFDLKRPFVNLNQRARVLQQARLFSGILGVAFLLVALTAPFTFTNVFVNKLDCAHVDVSNGLFTMLRDSVSADTDSLADFFGPGLTASEIELLSSYTETNVESCPQYIKSNVFNWCFGNYNLTEIDVNGTQTTRFVQEYCTDHDHNYVYDYRGELKTIGLNIILAYAYNDDSISTGVGNNDYLPDPLYVAKLNSRMDRSKAIYSMLIVALVLDALVLLLAVLMYGLRGYAKDDSTVPPFFRQFLPVLSLLASIAVCFSVTSMTVLSVEIRNEIANELGSFGISSHLGSIWFGIAWTAVATHLFNTCAWGGPAWCGAPAKSIKIRDSDQPSWEDSTFRAPAIFDEDVEEQESEEYEMLDHLDDNPFDDSNIATTESKELNPFAETTKPEPERRRRANLQGFFPKISPKKNKNKKAKRKTIDFTGDDYVNSDIFLTEDDKFIMKRENLLLDNETKK